MAQAGPASSGAPGLRLRIGTEVVAAEPAAVAAAVERANAARRHEGLPDTLNPDTIDPAKLSALLRALPQQAPIPAGRALYVDPAALQVGTGSPTTPDSFAGHVAFEVTDAKGNPVRARATVPMDADAARARAAEARAFVERTGQDIAKLEQGGVSNALSDARRRRYAAARVWRDNARALASSLPSDATARADREAAEQAVRSYIVPLGGGAGAPPG